MGQGLVDPPGLLWAGPLWAPWALMVQALVGWALVGTRWALVGRALVGPPGPLGPYGPGSCGPPGPSWAGP